MELSEMVVSDVVETVPVFLLHPATRIVVRIRIAVVNNFNFFILNNSP
jgi:hypothetical protein